MNVSQNNYNDTEWEFLEMVYASEKLSVYLMANKVVVYKYHAAVRYLMCKTNTKPILIRWMLSLQEFDFEIKDWKGREKQMGD